jgi:hypothetical protein
MAQARDQGAQTRKQADQIRKQAGQIRKQRIRTREQLARITLLTEKRVEALPQSARIPGWLAFASRVFSVAFGIIISATAVWLVVWPAE